MIYWFSGDQCRSTGAPVCDDRSGRGMNLTLGSGTAPTVLATGIGGLPTLRLASTTRLTVAGLSATTSAYTLSYVVRNEAGSASYAPYFKHVDGATAPYALLQIDPTSADPYSDFKSYADSGARAFAAWLRASRCHAVPPQLDPSAGSILTMRVWDGGSELYVNGVLLSRTHDGAGCFHVGNGRPQGHLGGNVPGG